MRNLTQPQGGAGLTLLCLSIAGVSLAVVVLISKAVAQQGVPMLWFLTVVLALSGLVQLAIAARLGQMRGWRRMMPYSVGAGAIGALPSALGYLSVAHVGAGYMSMTFAFPILLTWVFARLLGMEGRDPRRLLAVLLGLGGGVILALGKLGSVSGAATGWVLLASAIPVIIAAGNIFRTRYWPDGAQPVALAALLLLTGAVLTAPFALAIEGSPAPLLANDTVRVLLLVDVAVFVVQYIAYFNLQRIGGPVTLSLMGPVAAVVGAIAAMPLFGEALPHGFALAGALVAAGVVLMLWRGRLRLTLSAAPPASNCR
ncbi:EamA/RhaT family transporter [Paracoccus sp. M683]|uniref:EamA/RhaT family transporter n=1 Tax=Paracoccus sp. M683 TaxID=2594268 RepID=UPI001180F7FC|nr:EamA/RhaT family transporter [Paracoccus sp. M683]TRW98641.1 EamA/RhaT family transporter [Paracoccus sp. M683]